MPWANFIFLGIHLVRGVKFHAVLTPLSTDYDVGVKYGFVKSRLYSTLSRVNPTSTRLHLGGRPLPPSPSAQSPNSKRVLEIDTYSSVTTVLIPWLRWMCLEVPWGLNTCRITGDSFVIIDFFCIEHFYTRCKSREISNHPLGFRILRYFLCKNWQQIVMS